MVTNINMNLSRHFKIVTKYEQPEDEQPNQCCLALFSYFYYIELLLFAIIVKLYVYLRWNKPTFNLKYNVGIG
jgi:hypothetical protein